MSLGAKKPFELIADEVSGATRRTLRQLERTKTKVVNKIKTLPFMKEQTEEKKKKGLKLLCRDTGKGCK
jgi:hypothetical protein